MSQPKGLINLRFAQWIKRMAVPQAGKSRISASTFAPVGEFSGGTIPDSSGATTWIAMFDLT
jgi:hypothetical protein